MKLLLDTPIFLWLNADLEKLSPSALNACEDNQNELYLSVISTWEIQTKIRLNRLKLKKIRLAQLVQEQQVTNRLKILPLEWHHICALESLPLYHHDLFDRLLIAQAVAEQLFLVSANAQLNQYPVDMIW